MGGGGGVEGGEEEGREGHFLYGEVQRFAAGIGILFMPEII